MAFVCCRARKREVGSVVTSVSSPTHVVQSVDDVSAARFTIRLVISVVLRCA